MFKTEQPTKPDLSAIDQSLTAVHAIMEQHLIPIKKARELLALNLNLLQQQRVVAKAEELAAATGREVSYQTAFQILASEEREELKSR